MRRRVSFRPVLLWVMGVGLLAFVCTAGLALLDIQVSPVVIAALPFPTFADVGRAVSLHPDQAP
jgi:hypothetical protein